MTAILALLAATMIPSAGYLSFVRDRNFLEPGTFFCLVWTGAVILPLVLTPGYYVSPIAVLTISTFVWCTVFGAFLGASAIRLPERRAISPLRVLPPRFLIGLIVVCVGLAIFGVVIYAAGLGIRLRSLFSFEGLTTTGRYVAVARYADNYAGTAISRVLLVPGYLGAALGGYAFALRNAHRYRRARIWFFALLSIVPGVLMGLFMTTKSSLLFYGALWISAYIANRLYVTRGSFRPRIRRLVPLLVVSVLSLGGLFVFLNLVRYGWVGSGRSADAAGKLQLYAAGHLGAFSVWFDSTQIPLLPRTRGAFTFAGLFDLLGLQARQAGVVSDPVLISDGVNTNIYTMYRGIITDFGMVGGVLVLTIYGVLGGVAYRLQRRGGGAVSITVLLAFYTVAIWSPITSMFNYNSFIAVFIGFALLLLMRRRTIPPNGPAVLMLRPFPSSK